MSTTTEEQKKEAPTSQTTTEAAAPIEVTPSQQQQQQPPSQATQDTTKDTLIVFYSRSGYSRTIAQKISSFLGGNVEVSEVKPVESFSGIWGWLKSGYRSSQGAPIKLSASPSVSANFKTVWFGSPVQAGKISSPLKTWLDEHKAELLSVPNRTFNCFVTMGSGGDNDLYSQIEHLLGVKLTNKISVLQKNVGSWDASKCSVFAPASVVEQPKESTSTTTEQPMPVEKKEEPKEKEKEVVKEQVTGTTEQKQQPIEPNQPAPVLITPTTTTAP